MIARINAELGTTDGGHHAQRRRSPAMADRVMHLADGRIVARRDERAASSRQRSFPGEERIDRKLLRDLWQLKSQVVTVALVVASALSGFAGSLATYYSLVQARERSTNRRASGTCSPTSSAPRDEIERRIAAIPGVSDARDDSRVRRDAGRPGRGRADRRPDDRAAG